MMLKHSIFRQLFHLIIFLSSILVVLLATLSPFNFSIPNNFSLPEIFASFNNNSYFQDQLNNVLLFIPLGFTFTNLLQKLRIKPLIQIFLATLLSAGLSLTVELLQIFLPSRMPTSADIMNNSIGGFFGCICFYLWNMQSLSNTINCIKYSNYRRSSKQITAFFIGYIFLTILISLFWQSTTNLSNWDASYPLIIGNERTGNRPWKGYVSEVYIGDRAISTNEVAQGLADSNNFQNLGDSLLAHYQFKNKFCPQDQTEQLSELLWQGQPSNLQKDKGIFLDSSHWLETAKPVTPLNKRISRTSEFTLSAMVATANINQIGPARIISVSGDSQRRNLTLGQQGKGLDFRLRTPITGENGTELKLNIPNIFTDTNFHHIVITYSRATIQVYLDDLQNSYSFNLLELIPKKQKLFYYALTFIPLGIALAILTLLVEGRLLSSQLLIYSGILIPSLILEGILVTESGKHPSFNNLLIGVAFTAGTMLILRIRTAQLERKI